MSWWRREQPRIHDMSETIDVHRRIWADATDRLQQAAIDAQRIADQSKETSDRGLTELMDFMSRPK